MNPSVLIAALLVATGLYAQSASAQQPVQASQLLGKPVAGTDGRDVGALHDLIIDTKEGRIAYAVVIVGMKLVAVPLAAGASKDKLVVDGTQKALRKEPGFSETTYPDFNAAEPEGDAKVRYRALRTMVDGDLKDAAGKDVGDVKDFMVVIEDARVANIVVEFDRAWYDKEGWVALPRESILHRGNDVIANFEPDNMRPASEVAREKARQEALRKAAEAAARSLDREERASVLIGKPVADLQGASLGKIADLVVDPASHRVTQVVIAGPAGTKALPLPAPNAYRSAEGLVVNAEQLAAAPAGGHRASRLMGTDLRDHQNEDVGDVQDLIVNLGTGKLRYAIARFVPTWVAAGKVAAIPIRDVRDDGGKPVMRSGLHQLQGALIFDDKEWPPLDHPQYRAYMDQYLQNTK